MGTKLAPLLAAHWRVHAWLCGVVLVLAFVVPMLLPDLPGSGGFLGWGPSDGLIRVLFVGIVVSVACGYALVTTLLVAVSGRSRAAVAAVHVAVVVTSLAGWGLLRL
jgi:hypothetical protein